MINNNYLEAITESKDLLSELLNDPDHGTLTFVGMHDLDDLTITAPQELDDLISGTVLVVGRGEWMALTAGEGERRHWQNFASSRVASSEELYTLALNQPGSLSCCHKGL